MYVALLFILLLVIDFSEFGNCERVKSQSQILFISMLAIFKFCSTQFLLINTSRTHLTNVRLLLVYLLIMSLFRRYVILLMLIVITSGQNKLLASDAQTLIPAYTSICMQAKCNILLCVCSTVQTG